MGAFGDFFNKAKDYVSFREFLHASTNGHSGFVSHYLNRNPGDLNKTEVLSGRNALMCAITANAEDTVKLLLRKGATLTGQDKSGYNALHMAVLCAPKTVTDMLLQTPGVSAIINEKNRMNGMTALMYAATGPEDMALVQRLLEKGADPHMKDFMGRTAAAIARTKGSLKVAALLEQWKPQPSKPIIRRQRPGNRKFDF